VTRAFCFSNAASAVANLDLISHVHLASFVLMLPNQLIYFTFFGCFLFIIICAGNDCLDILITIAFPRTFPFHSIFQFHLVYQSCPVVPHVPEAVAQSYLYISQCEYGIISESCYCTVREVAQPSRIFGL
jgi:hypothetical protein